MAFEFLTFLTDPMFVIPWYGFGVLAAGWVLYDTLTHNQYVNDPLKAGWPIIVTFFSVIGLILYLWTCRPPGIANRTGENAKQLHHDYVKAKWKRVTGSVIHCVGGDGLGIMTAMVIARLLDFSFWSEFWFEYAVGFAFGWFVFQFWAMRNMGNAPLEALWKGGRAEFFSMITVMIGMGLVMRFVTPEVVGHSPKPDTASFWGFASLGLLVGAIVTYPMNWWLVSIGWKHGMA
jgi:hypothetical protein